MATIYEVAAERLMNAALKLLRHVEGEGMEPRDLDGEVRLVIYNGQLTGVNLWLAQGDGSVADHVFPVSHAPESTPVEHHPIEYSLADLTSPSLPPYIAITDEAAEREGDETPYTPKRRGVTVKADFGSLTLDKQGHIVHDTGETSYSLADLPAESTDDETPDDENEI